jgi:hypothetical protein
MELPKIAKIKADLPLAVPEQLMAYSKEAYEHLYKEIEILADDKEAGLLMSDSERYLHEFRLERWRGLFENVWIEINNRGQDVKSQLIHQVLSKNPLYSQN